MLRQITDGLWVHDMPLKVLVFDLGARMTLLRLSTGDLALISPVSFDASVRDAINKLGRVRFLVAPSLTHYKYLPHAKEMFPEAIVLGAPGLKEKKPQLPIDQVLGSAPAFDDDAAIAQHRIGGMPQLGEVAFLHKPTRTLVLTDLIFYFRDAPNWPTGLYLKLSKALGVPAQTSFLRAAVKDKAALRASRDALLAWDFDRVIVTHRDVIETGGKDALRSALAWIG